MAPGAKPTEGDNYKLLFGLISQLEVKNIDWEKLAKDIGVSNVHTAKSRWNALRKKERSLGGGSGSGSVQSSPVKKRANGDGDDDDDGDGEAPKKRKVGKNGKGNKGKADWSDIEEDEREGFDENSDEEEV